jgi:uncharacterized protein YciI
MERREAFPFSLLPFSLFFSPMPEYLYLIHPFRDGFFSAPTPEEEDVMEAHFQYLKKASGAGIVRLAGPCLDETFGLVVFQAESEAAAQAFMLGDPSIKANVMMAELHPFRVSLEGILSTTDEHG